MIGASVMKELTAESILDVCLGSECTSERIIKPRRKCVFIIRS